MKQSKPLLRNSGGFSPLIVIVTIAAIAILAGGGYYVFQKNNDTKPNSSNTAQQDKNDQKDNEGDTPDTQDPKDLSEGGKYLVISEWGVRFPVPEDLKGDITYAIRTNSDQSQVAYFEVGKIADLPGSKCNLDGSNEGIGAFIARTSEEIGELDSKLYYKANQQINGYWFSGGYGKMSDSCAGEGDNQILAGQVGRKITFELDKITAASEQ